MPHTKYQDSMHCGFKQEYFILKIYFSPCDLNVQWTKLFEQLFKRVI